MRNRLTEISPQAYARTGGVLYLILIILGFVNVVIIRGSILVPGNAAATMGNLRTMETLWRVGIATEHLTGFIAIVLALIFYVLTKPVSREFAILGLLFNMIAIAIQTAYSLRLVEVLLPLSSAPLHKTFSEEQISALIALGMKSHELSFGIALLFFGPFFLVTGMLVYASGYMPKTVGILYLLPGICYLTSSFLLMVAPGIGEKYYFFIAGPAIIGELTMALWLLVKGINLQKWNEVIGRYQTVG